MSSRRKAKQKSRVPIPIKTQIELWAKAAGRCEFRGCNKLLYLDELTKTKDNLSLISHIIAAEPGGPRGDDIESPRLVKDISNLMLTCKDHGKIIDSKEHVSDYPVELLRGYKQEHEKRIKILTDIQAEAKSHILIFQAPINGKIFNIDITQAHKAILPKYPARENPFLIDFSDLSDKETEDGYWNWLTRNTKRKFDAIFNHEAKRRDINHISLFALAPIPLLVYLGYLIGDITTVDLYQRHRRSKDWNWEENSEDSGKEFYRIIEPDIHKEHYQTAILISVSGMVDRERATDVVGKECNIYEIVAITPGLDFLSSRLKLKEFCREYRQLLCGIRSHNGHIKELHLFCAAPSPIAIECGRSVLSKSDPPIKIYDLIKDTNGFVYALTINENSPG